MGGEADRNATQCRVVKSLQIIKHAVLICGGTAMPCAIARL